MQTCLRKSSADYGRALEIATVVVLLTFTALFTGSKTVDVTFTSTKEALKEIPIIKIPNTEQKIIKSKPTTIKIPLPMDIDDESDPDYEPFEIEKATFAFNEVMPPAPDFVEVSEDPVPFYSIQDKPKLLGNIYENLKYPAMARMTGTSGSVTLKFICSKEGIPVNITILQERPADMGFGKEALRAMKRARFKPGYQNDRPVAVSMVQKIKFKVK